MGRLNTERIKRSILQECRTLIPGVPQGESYFTCKLNGLRAKPDSSPQQQQDALLSKKKLVYSSDLIAFLLDELIDEGYLRGTTTEQGSQAIQVSRLTERGRASSRGWSERTRDDFVQNSHTWPKRMVRTVLGVGVRLVWVAVGAAATGLSLFVVNRLSVSSPKPPQGPGEESLQPRKPPLAPSPVSPRADSLEPKATEARSSPAETGDAFPSPNNDQDINPLPDLPPLPALERKRP